MKKKIIYQDLDGKMHIGSEKNAQRAARQYALHHEKPFITIDERHMDQRIRVCDGKYAEEWAAFDEALKRLIDAGEIYCAILTERDEK